eukprot:8030694-Prorocentrum_lima.AAC.1
MVRALSPTVPLRDHETFRIAYGHLLVRFYYDWSAFSFYEGDKNDEQYQDLLREYILMHTVVMEHLARQPQI